MHYASYAKLYMWQHITHEKYINDE